MKFFSANRTGVLAAQHPATMAAQAFVFQGYKPAASCDIELFAERRTRNSRTARQEAFRTPCRGGFSPERCSWHAVLPSVQHRARLPFHHPQQVRHRRCLVCATACFDEGFTKGPSVTYCFSDVVSACRMDRLLGHCRRLLQ